MDRIIPITTLKTNVADIIRDIDANPIVITQNGDAKAVLISKREYDNMMDTLYMLKIAALGKKQIEECKTYSVEEAFRIATEITENE